MTLQINGEPREVPSGLTVAGLVAHLGMKSDRVAVELNLEIVPRANWEATHLKDGDKLEIVHFVGGGSVGAAMTPAETEARETVWSCPSCETQAAGRFCSQCGEKKASTADLSVRHLMSHAAGELLHYDSKIFRSFRLLFARPGFLSAEYVRGCRKPYLHPVQIFVIANILYFFLQPLTTWSGLATYLPLHEHSPFYGTLATRMVAQHLAVKGMTRAQLGPLFTHKVDLYAKSMVVLMVPMFAGALLLLERRRKRFFGEHAVFASHFCAFWLISVLLVLYGGAAAVMAVLRHWGIAILYGHADLTIYLIGSVFVAAYLTKALRTFYGDTLSVAIVKSVALIACTIVALQVYRFILFVSALYSA